VRLGCWRLRVVGGRWRRCPANLGIASVYLAGIDSAEIIETVHVRKAPMISANAGLRLQASLRVPSAFGASKLIAFGLRMTVASGSGERIAVARRPE
jgi:hypothetical protein